MKLKMTRFLTLLVLLICLPLQGFAAVSMAVCQKHGAKTEIHVSVQETEDMSRCDHHDADKADSKTPCNKCLNCHLNIGQAIFPISMLVEFSGFSAVYTVVKPAVSDSTPASIYHPPRSVLS